MRTPSIGTLSECLFFSILAFKCCSRDCIKGNLSFQSITLGVQIPSLSSPHSASSQPQLLALPAFTPNFKPTVVNSRPKFFNWCISLDTHMWGIFSWQSNTNGAETQIPPTLHGSQGKTEFATYLSGLPQRTWDTPVAKLTMYNDNTTVAELRQYRPPVAMRKTIFAPHKSNLDLQADDLVNVFTRLDSENETCNSLTPCNNPLNTLAQPLTPDSSFYVNPFVERKEFPKALASTSQWMNSVKSEMKQARTRVKRWMVVPSWNKSVFAKMYLMRASGPAIILKQWIAKVHVFHQVAPQRAALRNGSIQISDGYVSDMPMFALFLDSSKAAHEPITFHDRHLGSRPVNWGLQKADIGRSIEETVRVVRFDASHKPIEKILL